MNAGKITLNPVSTIGGVEVLGVDLRREQVDAVKASLKKACLEYSFVLIRGQDITFDEQFRFGRIFGEILENISSAPKGNIAAYLSEISTEGKRPTSDLLLHFDHWLISNFPRPVHFTMLYGMQVVPVGGETVFANARNAYRLLPESVKARIEDMQAVHCYDYSPPRGDTTDVRVREADIPPDQPQARHPVVLVHPFTGERILYVSPRNTDRILGLEPEESETLIKELLAYIEEPGNVYAHRWNVGDLLLWDNHSLLHGRRNFDPRHRRHLRRLSIL
jgi:alpha-ketoglutarate-dependent taurine dioxygenase